MRKIVFLALLAFALSAGTVFADRQRVPNFTLTDQSGNTLQFSDIVSGGRPVVLSFTASWCPGCRSKMPWLDRAYRDFGGNVRFVTLALANGAEQTKRYIEERGYALPVYIDSLHEGAMAFALEFIPYTVLIDASGYIVTDAQGRLDEETLRKAIASLDLNTWRPRIRGER